LKTSRGRCASLLCQIHLGAWRPTSTMEIRSITEIYNSRQAPEVGVPIAEVVNTIASWLRWMASSYVGHLDTKSTSLRSACLKYLGLAIPWYDYGPANLVGRPICVTFRGQCAFVALPACSGHPGFYVENKGSPVGCAPNGPAKYFWVLGACILRPS
jgi:hypothetical protein